MRQGVLRNKIKEDKMIRFIFLLAISLLILLPFTAKGSWWEYFDTPDGVCPTVYSSLTYGYKPSEHCGKLFLLVGQAGCDHFRFFWTYAKNYFGRLDWHELPVPPYARSGGDAAISYVYNPSNNDEKVFAVYPQILSDQWIWCYDVKRQTWTPVCRIGGNDGINQGASLEFWGLREIMGQPVVTLYLIKGGWSYEFMRFNYPYLPGPRMNFPYWERLAPFNISGDSEPFTRGADLAIYNWNPYSYPRPDTIFAMRGYSFEQEHGKPFGLYRIKQNQWYGSDSLKGDGADYGGALVSHPLWRSDDNELEVWSILHCFRGGNAAHFDCFDIPHPQSEGGWYVDPTNPDYIVGWGSDIVYGAYWFYGDSIDGLWACFGAENDKIGFYHRDTRETGGSQFSSSFIVKNNDVTVFPNPAKSKTTFRTPRLKSDGCIRLYTESGKRINSLKLIEGNAVWDLKSTEDKLVPSGIYFYTIRVENKETRGKLIVNR
jgi:hypothetical protein